MTKKYHNNLYWKPMSIVPKIEGAKIWVKSSSNLQKPFIAIYRDGEWHPINSIDAVVKDFPPGTMWRRV